VIDPSDGLCIVERINLILPMKNNNSITILRNKLTGLFFDGTNFSAENVLKAKRVGANVSEVAIKSIWGENTQVITVANDKIEKLELSEELEARANAHRKNARSINHTGVAGQLEGAATRLQKRSNALSYEVYTSFPNYGRNA
tara:strand:+ start:152 stop:580 length:429 start_codon:yes stop_codon:yes gene_type:complete